PSSADRSARAGAPDQARLTVISVELGRMRRWVLAADAHAFDHAQVGVGDGVEGLVGDGGAEGAIEVANRQRSLDQRRAAVLVLDRVRLVRVLAEDVT